MKKRWIAIALLTVLLMGIGGAIGKVGVRQESGGSAYALYFVERDLRSADGGDALRSEERTLEDGGLSTEELAAALVAELLKGPADPTLKSPFPKGTALLSAEQKGTELRVDLSAAYSTLSGVGLSLADYAITLTLTQLPDVARVRITVAGRELDYRSRQVFLARDILTVPKEDVVGTVDTSLYFVNGDGALTAEARTLNLYEGDTQVSAVVRALENGPETKGLSGVLPEGFKVRKVWLEEEICYVSLSSALLEGQPEPETLSQAVLALEQSLLSLESVEEVRFLVDGELADTYGPTALPENGRTSKTKAVRFIAGRPFLVIKFVDGNGIAKLCFQGLQLGEGLRPAVALLVLRGLPGFHQQKRVRVLSVQKVVIFQVAGFVNGTGPDT